MKVRQLQWMYPHVQESKGLVTCKACGRKFGSLEAISRHAVREHPNKTPAIELRGKVVEVVRGEDWDNEFDKVTDIRITITPREKFPSVSEAV